jgi:predicted MFS family arabinose efflux permease
MAQAELQPPLTTPEPGTSPLRRREFRLYFTGNLASNAGTWLQNAAMSVFLFRLTGSSFWVGMASAAQFVPILLLALPAGSLADRGDRLQLMRRAQLAAGLLALLLTVLVAADLATKYVALAIVFGMGVFGAVAIPAMQSMVPLLVPRSELPQAIGLNSLTFNMARAIGPLIAAAALSIGVAWAFGLNALSFFVLVAVLGMIGSLPFPHERTGEPGTIAQGVKYAWNHPRLRRLLFSVMAIAASVDPLTTLAPALVTSYGLDSGKAPFILSSWGAGAALGVTLGGRLMKRLFARRLGWVGLPALSFGLLGLATARSLPVAVLAALVCGWGFITSVVSFTTTIQLEVPDELRGKVSALWTMCFLGPRVLSGLLDGRIADAIGPHRATALFALPALAAIWAARQALRSGAVATDLRGRSGSDRALDSPAVSRSNE